MHAADQATLASSIELMEKLERVITSRTIYGPTHPSGHTYEVVMSKTRGEGVDEYEARLIVHIAQRAPEMSGGWILLLANPSFCESPVDAMVDLLERLYESVGVALKGTKVGETYPRLSQA